jgi:hypothetical protein
MFYITFISNGNCWTEKNYSSMYEVVDRIKECYEECRNSWKNLIGQEYDDREFKFGVHYYPNKD